MIGAGAIFDPAAILAWGAVVMALALGYALWRTGGAKVWRETAEAYKARTEEQEAELRRVLDRLAQQDARLTELQARCDALSALPDLTKVLDLTQTMLEKHDRLVVDLVGKLTQEVKKLTDAIERVELRWG